MKILKKFLPLPALALLILVACTNPLAKQPAEEKAATEVAPAAVTTDDTNGATSESRYGSGMKCSLLQNADNRQACEQLIGEQIGSMLESEILSGFDLKRCEELSADIVKECQERLNATGVIGPVSDEELAIFSDAVKGERVEPKEGEEIPLYYVYNKAKCAGLLTPGYKEYCEKQIREHEEQNKLDQIIQSNDVSRCDELSEEVYSTLCRSFFGIESGPETIEPEGAEEAVNQ